MQGSPAVGRHAVQLAAGTAAVAPPGARQLMYREMFVPRSGVALRSLITCVSPAPPAAHVDNLGLILPSWWHIRQKGSAAGVFDMGSPPPAARRRPPRRRGAARGRAAHDPATVSRARIRLKRSWYGPHEPGSALSWQLMVAHSVLPSALCHLIGKCTPKYQPPRIPRKSST